MFARVTLPLNKTLVLVFLLFPLGLTWAQRDSLRLSNNDLLVGEVKELVTGVITMETDYSDKDFQIEFNKVRELIIQRKCIILLTEGRRRFGNIRSRNSSEVVITLEDGNKEVHPIKEVIGLQEVEDKFWQRITAALDLGYTLTKANSNSQLTFAGRLQYTGEIWLIEGTGNLLRSSQQGAEDVRRADANLVFNRLLPKKWYLLGETTFLSNTEQALDARITPSLGLGRLLISTNKLYWTLATGYSLNIENFQDASLNKTSSELFLKSSFSLFDFEDIDLLTSILIYPSLSEQGRLRTDYDFTVKYDLPLDFYIKAGFTFNYDNQPAVTGNQFDYIITSGIGWEFN